MESKRARFEAEVLPHLDSAYRFALGLSRSRTDAEDLVQDAILRAFRNFDALRGEAKPWLMTIIRNCFLTDRTKRNRGTEVSLSDETHATAAEQLSADVGAGPESSTIEADQRRSLSALLSQLAAEHREVLVLREIEDMSYREIANIAGVRIGTVMSRLARARLHLRELWKAAHREECA